MGTMMRVRDDPFCRPCADRYWEASGHVIPASWVAPLSDPTVCARCGRDGGDAELPARRGRPTCPPCAARAARGRVLLVLGILGAGLALLALSLAVR